MMYGPYAVRMRIALLPLLVLVCGCAVEVYVETEPAPASTTEDHVTVPACVAATTTFSCDAETQTTEVCANLICKVGGHSWPESRCETVDGCAD